MAYTSLSTLEGETLSSYMAKIFAIPLLTLEQEQSYARAWKEKGDTKAAQELVMSHLRIVPKVVFHYKGYGLPLMDMISEGNLGLMQAVKNFDPDRGFRLVTYALWWVRASVQDFILRSWSIVKMTSSSAQKRLFFHLKREKEKIGAYHALNESQARQIASTLQVSKQDVEQMEARFSGDLSLHNVIPNSKGDGDSGVSFQDALPETAPTQEESIGEEQEKWQWRKKLSSILRSLPSRDRFIFWSRHLKQTPSTLETLSTHFGISRERVRQIEGRTFQKVKKLTLEEREES